ncbi:hypothetical protein BpHYR1_032767 [Brachionus plicatilis]|uniref:Uncharacterized protein n=1 Tax=Brachionus plicatilis TaxID=10195 RepID=A0A3M7QFM9_BRAPC|nr:hypothetical protein BpHYR1_032767 [Brachionus plicatilis]
MEKRFLVFMVKRKKFQKLRHFYKLINTKPEFKKIELIRLDIFEDLILKNLPLLVFSKDQGICEYSASLMLFKSIDGVPDLYSGVPYLVFYNILLAITKLNDFRYSDTSSLVTILSSMMLK